MAKVRADIITLTFTSYKKPVYWLTYYVEYDMNDEASGIVATISAIVGVIVTEYQYVSTAESVSLAYFLFLIPAGAVGGALVGILLASLIVITVGVGAVVIVGAIFLGLVSLVVYNIFW